jgi:tRNA(fMet)-specific endonuclease VapC
MKYLMDANSVIHLIADAFPKLSARVAESDAGSIGVSSVAFAEVIWGSANGKPPILPLLDAFAQQIPIVGFDEAAARAYASIPFKRGTFDRLIAAQALSLDLIVISSNEKDFADVPGLKVENWTV